MTHPDVTRLMRLVPPPPQPHIVDLDAFEREVGAALPTDFAQLTRAYGTGTFDDFLSLLDPDPSKRYSMFTRTSLDSSVGAVE